VPRNAARFKASAGACRRWQPQIDAHKLTNAVKSSISDASACTGKSQVFRHAVLRAEMPSVLWESGVIA